MIGHSIGRLKLVSTIKVRPNEVERLAELLVLKLKRGSGRHRSMPMETKKR